jgi:very-short-patch-repair endonuclease
MDDVFLGSAAVEAGLVTRSQLRGRRFQRVMHGVYADARLPRDHLLFCRAASLVVPDGVVAARSAAWLWGARSGVGRDDDVMLTLPPRRTSRRRRGVTARRAHLPTQEVVRRQGLAVTSPVRTVWDIAATDPEDIAVPVLDEMLQRRVVTAGDLEDFVTSRAGRRGSARAARTVQLLDGNAESPPESRVRLALTRAGLRPRTQVDVVDFAGRFIARVDMAYPELRLAVEYDGGWHAEPGQLSRDRDRLNRLQAAGWTVIFVTAPDLRRLDGVVDRVRGARARLSAADTARARD